jgi:amidophosphoribosyltransferase
MTRRLSLPVLRSTTHTTNPAAPSPRDASAPKEKCGVFGIWGHPQSARLSYLGLYAQQHRGQESAGIAVSDGEVLSAETGMGLVAEIFDTESIEHLDHLGGKGAIGHNRYSTAGGSLACNAQPLLESYIGGQVAVAHNGNLINNLAMRRRFEEAGHLFHTTSDTEVIIHLLASPQQQKSVDPLAATLRHLQGAFSLVFLFPDRIEAARDPWGWRPLVLGQLPSGDYVVASETVALDVVGARVIREVDPGEIVTINDHGVSTRHFAEEAPRPAYCVFEHVYFANPASHIFGQNVQLARETMGEKLAEEAPPGRTGSAGSAGSSRARGSSDAGADFVVPMPDSGRSAALGYARKSGIPYREAIVPNRYVGRTFIKPTQDQRAAAVRLKLNIIDELVRGRRLVIVDDSIVRGTTTKAKMDQLRAAGAKEIHLRISCPPIRHPCYFGVDFAERSQLIATGKTVEQIKDYLGVDSLHYLSLEGLLSCMTRPGDRYCTACYSGEYRLDPEHPVTEEVVEPEQVRLFE